MATAWKKITKEIDHKVLVTNNRAARDAKGQPSHVWIVDIVTKSRKYDFCGFQGSSLIMSLTHFAEIPK